MRCPQCDSQDIETKQQETECYNCGYKGYNNEFTEEDDE